MLDDPSRAVASGLMTLAVLMTVVGTALQPVERQPISPSHHPPAMAAPPPDTPPIQETGVASVVVTPTPTPTPEPTVHIPVDTPPPATGTKYDWMRAAGIPEADWPYVDLIISHESSWRPEAVNPTSGACGLAQQLPCGKWPHRWNDPVGALIDASVYAKDRYGGWQPAWIFWQQHRWW